jgi:tetratricopeptide (TPR) repeat protein
MSRRTPSAAALVLASASLGCIARSFPKTPAAGGPAWQEMTTEHFVVDTDLEPAEARLMARQLENLRHVMADLVFGGEPAPAPRVRVLALRQDEYAHFGHVAAGNFISWTLYQPILVTSPGGDWDTFAADVRKHELAHYVSNLYVDMRLQPRWFAEGTAAYLETIRYDEKTGAVEIGRHPTDYQYLEYMKPVTTEELWDWDKSTPYDDLRARLYATSWAVAHYLFDQRPTELLDYERALARGQDSRKAWTEIFPDLDSAGLTDTIKKYVHKRDFKVTRAKIPPVEVAAQTRPLSEADVLGLRAELYMALQSTSKRTPEETKRLARTMVEASFAQDPASFWAHQVNLFYFDSVPSFADLARKAIANQKENWLAWLWYAEVLRRGKGPLDEQRLSLSKALELAPGNPIALTQLAWVEARSGNWKAALDASSKAVHSPPVGTDAMIALASALSHSGQCTDARTIEELIQERLKKNLPKDTAQIFTENHQACAQSPPDSARR